MLYSIRIYVLASFCKLLSYKITLKEITKTEIRIASYTTESVDSYGK